MTAEQCGTLIKALWGVRKLKKITRWCLMRCLRRDCKRCQSPKFKELRLWQGRGMRGRDILKRAHQAMALHAASHGLGRIMTDKSVDPRVRDKLVRAVNSRTQGNYASIWDSAGGLTILVPADVEKFVAERAGPPLKSTEVTSEAIDLATAHGIRGAGGLLAKRRFDSCAVIQGFKGGSITGHESHPCQSGGGASSAAASSAAASPKSASLQPSSWETPLNECGSYKTFKDQGWSFADEDRLQSQLDREELRKVAEAVEAAEGVFPKPKSKGKEDTMTASELRQKLDRLQAGQDRVIEKLDELLGRQDLPEEVERDLRQIRQRIQ